MFCVIFEVHPKAAQWDAYLGYARLLRPEIERIDGFLDNIRYRSLTRPGWLLSLSHWRDEKALVRWRVQATHHHAQEKGRFEIFEDYHLRVGEVTADSRLPEGSTLQAQRLDETAAGAAAATLLDTSVDAETVKNLPPIEIASALGLREAEPDRVAWDVFEAILTPGDVILLQSWRDRSAAEASGTARPAEARYRQVRIIRDYGMFDRREAPQYYPAVEPARAAET